MERDVLIMGVETGGRDFHVVGILGDVVKTEDAVLVGLGFLLETGARIIHLDRRSEHCGVGLVQDRAGQGRGIAQGLRAELGRQAYSDAQQQ